MGWDTVGWDTSEKTERTGGAAARLRDAFRDGHLFAITGRLTAKLGPLRVAHRASSKARDMKVGVFVKAMLRARISASINSAGCLHVMQR